MAAIIPTTATRYSENPQAVIASLAAGQPTLPRKTPRGTVWHGRSSEGRCAKAAMAAAQVRDEGPRR